MLQRQGGVTPLSLIAHCTSLRESGRGFSLGHGAVSG